MVRTASGMHSTNPTRQTRRSVTPANDIATVDITKRPTRTTRSQSREPQVTTRQTRATAAREGSVENSVSNAGSAGSTRSNVRFARRGQVEDPLPSLDEESEAESSLPADAFDHDSDQDEVAARPLSVASMTGASANTEAQTTYSQEEIETLDASVMLDGFSELSNCADRVLDLIVPASASREVLQITAGDMVNPRTNLHRVLSKRLHLLVVQQESYGSQAYALPEFILRSLLKLSSVAHLQSAPWRPDDIIFKANLATLIGAISQSSTAKDQTEMLQSLDHIFPSRFMLSLERPEDESGRVGESLLDVSTCNLALEIRTQLVIRYLTANENIDEPESPDAILSKTFLGLEDDADIELFPGNLDAAMLRTWDTITAETAPRFHNDVVERIKEIRGFFETESGEVISSATSVDYLSSAFPWEGFQTELLVWTQARAKETVDCIAARGGVDKITKYLSQEASKRRSSIGPVYLKTPTVTPRPSIVDTSKSRGLDRGLFRETGSDAASLAIGNRTTIPPMLSNTPAADAPTDQLLNNDEDPDQLFVQQDEVDAEADTENVNPRSALIAEARSARRQEKSRYIDAQENAEKVAFDESQSQAPRFRLPPGQTNAVASSSAPRVGNKRKLTTVEDADDDDNIDPSQDDGFQTDNRVLPRRPLSDIRPPSSVTSGIREQSPPRASGSGVVLPRTSDRAENGALNPPASRARKNPGQAIDPLPAVDMGAGSRPRPTPISRLQQISQQNRMNRPAPTSVQVRTPWSLEETGRLLDLIENHGISYAMLKRIDETTGNVLRLRDPEAMRFKARNIKVDILKGGGDLPENFENVAIGKKEIDQLARFGIDYQQEQLRYAR